MREAGASVPLSCCARLTRGALSIYLTWRLNACRLAARLRGDDLASVVGIL